MAKKTTSDNLKRLYWRTDKEQIYKIIERIPDKYLIGLLLKPRDYDYSYLERTHILKYDGCYFNVSVKSLRKEAVRRGLAQWQKKFDFDNSIRFYFIRNNRE